MRVAALAAALVAVSQAALCEGPECEAIIGSVCPKVRSPESCVALWSAFITVMNKHTEAPSSDLRWRHLAHRATMLSKSMFRPECWGSLPHQDEAESSGPDRPSCMSTLCLIDNACHERHIVHELMAIAKQVDDDTAREIWQATRHLFGWERFEQTPMMYYPSLSSQVWFDERDYPDLVQSLRSNFPAIRAEFLEAYGNRSGRLTPEEEEYSGRQGWWCWDVWTAIDGWRRERCNQMPTLCRALRPHLPASKAPRLAAYLQEEVALFGLPPGDIYFAPHNDGTNARVALLMPLTGGEWSSLTVRGERRSFGADGEILGFDASFDHSAAYDAPQGSADRWVLSVAVSHPDFDPHLEAGKLQNPAPDVQLLEDPQRWRREEGEPEPAVTGVAGSVSDALARLVAERLPAEANVVLLGGLEALAPVFLQSPRVVVAGVCDSCDTAGPALNERLRGMLSTRQMDRLVLVPRSQTMWEDAFETGSVSMVVTDAFADVLSAAGASTKISTAVERGFAHALRPGALVVGVGLPAPTLPAGSTLHFEAGLWWFAWPGSAPISTQSPTELAAPFGEAAVFAAEALQASSGFPAEDAPEPVLVAMVTRYAHNNARLALRCLPEGAAGSLRNSVSELGAALDAAQEAVRSRHPAAKDAVSAVAQEAAQLLTSLGPQLPKSCPIPVPVARAPAPEPVSGGDFPPEAAIGFGTHELQGPECYAAVLAALKAGVRHIDTAQGYHNAAEVGRALKDSQVPRSAIYLATKLSSTGLQEEEAYKELAAELDRLGPGAHADLCYLHFPSGENLPAWRALESLSSEGRCRQLGLSNFGQEEIQHILAHSRFRPVALQTQFSIYEPPSAALLAWLQQQRIAVVAAASLNPSATANLNPMQDPHVLHIAAAHGRSASQVLLRWLLHRGASVLPRSRSAEHIAENSRLRDFALSAEEIGLLNGVATLMHTSRRGILKPSGMDDIYKAA